MSDSVRPHRQQATRLPRPWDSPGKNTGVGCHFLLQYMKVKSESEVAQSCPTPSDPMDCSPPGSSIFLFPTLSPSFILFSPLLSFPSLLLSLLPSLSPFFPFLLPFLSLFFPPFFVHYMSWTHVLDPSLFHVKPYFIVTSSFQSCFSIGM